MIETFLSMILGSVAPYFIERIKRSTKLNAKVIWVRFILIAAAMYTAYVIFVPVEVQTNVVQFVAVYVATAVGLYETIFKKKFAKTKPSNNDEI